MNWSRRSVASGPNDGAPAAAESPYWALPDGPSEGCHGSASCPGSASSSSTPGLHQGGSSSSTVGTSSAAQPSISSSAGYAGNAGTLGWFRRSSEGYQDLSSSAEPGAVGLAADKRATSTSMALSAALAALRFPEDQGNGSQRCWVAQKFDAVTRGPQPAGLGLEHKLEESLLDRPPPRQPLQDLHSFLAGNVPGLGRQQCSQDLYQFLSGDAPSWERDHLPVGGVPGSGHFDRRPAEELASSSTASPPPPPPAPATQSPAAPAPAAAAAEREAAVASAVAAAPGSSGMVAFR